MLLKIQQGAIVASFTGTEVSNPVLQFREISSEDGDVYLTYASSQERDKAKEIVSKLKLMCGEMKHQNGYVLFFKKSDLIIQK